MNIVIIGAGAIGSLFGSALSKNNNVVLVGRKSHVDAVNKKGLTIKGKTQANIKFLATESVKDISFSPDILLFSVKSYDAESAIKTSKSIIGKNTVVMSLQNGLNNIEKIKKHVNSDKIIVCITTHGVVFSKPGVIQHTGIGKTILGDISGKNTEIIEKIANDLKLGEIKTIISENIIKDIWAKAIVNSSINPLTAIFNCKNGYLLENPIIEKTLEKICRESTDIADSCKINLNFEDMLKKTEEVIHETSENHSSMLQSVQQNKPTEIESINGTLAKIGKENNIETLMNDLLVYSVKSIICD